MKRRRKAWDGSEWSVLADFGPYVVLLYTIFLHGSFGRTFCSAIRVISLNRSCSIQSEDMKKGLALLILALLLATEFCDASQVLRAKTTSSADNGQTFHPDLASPDASNSTASTNSAVQLWNFTTYGSVRATPVLADGYLYAVSSRQAYDIGNGIYCLNASSGELVWNYTAVAKAENYLESAARDYTQPVAFNGVLYTSLVGNLLALNASTGVAIRNDTDFADGPPVLVGGYLYVYHQEVVRCLDAATGTQVWNFTAESAVGFLVIDHERGYAFADSAIYALSASAGTKIWNQTANFSQPTFAPVFGNGNFYMVYNEYNASELRHVSGTLYCLDAATGSEKWTFATDVSVSVPAVSDDKVFVGSGDDYLYALNASSGNKIWNYTTQRPVDSPVVENDRVYVGSAGTMYCFDASTGERIWNYRTLEPANSLPIVVDDQIYFGCSGPSSIYHFEADYLANHTLYALDALTGTKIWSYVISGNIGALVVEGDTIYLGTGYISIDNPGYEDDAAVYALKLVTVAPTPTPQPTTPHPVSTPPPSSIVVPDDYPSITEGLSHAPSGGTVFVRKGTYRETIFLGDEPITLMGEDRYDTVIMAGGQPSFMGTWATITVDGDNVTITGFTITHALEGVYIKAGYNGPSPSHCKIIGNNIVNVQEGIWAEGGDDILISENYIAGNTGGGIRASTSNTTISWNNVTGNGGGINAGGKNVAIYGNNVSNTTDGISLRNDGPLNVYGNNITSNPNAGITFGEGCSNATVYQNNVERNGIGVKLLNFPLFGSNVIGSKNTFYRNNIVNNSQQVLVQRENSYGPNWYDYKNGTDIVTWENGEEGNYWSDYNTRYPDAKEVGTSGTENTPYVIDEKNVDYYPLVNPVDISAAIPSAPSASIEPLLIVAAVVVFVTAAVAAYTIRRRKRETPASS